MFRKLVRLIFRLALTIIVFVFGAITAVNADESRDPIEAFTELGEYNFKLCTINYAIEYGALLLGREAEEEDKFSTCERSAKEKMAVKFKAAKVFLEDKSAAVDALKKYYSFWMTAIEAASFGIPLDDPVYDARWSANLQKLIELKNDLIIEAM